MGKIFLIVGMIVLTFATNAAAKTTVKLLEFHFSDKKSEMLRVLLDEFEAINTDIKVEVVTIPWGKKPKEVILMLNGADAPDIMEMPDHWLALFTSGELLLNLESKINNWPNRQTLDPITMNVARQVEGIFTVPYGLYLRGLFYNKKLLKQAGIEKPPHTIAELMAAVEAVSKLDGKSGYCFRGGVGGIHLWFMMAAAMNGSGEFFTEDGKSTFNQPGSVEGVQFILDMYQKGYAPKESVNWGYKDVVSQFASGNCAFLDQDPDALGGILKTMNKDDFAVIPMPVGPSGKAFPSIDFGGWSITSSSKHPDETWRVLSFLLSPEQNLKWTKSIGVMPVHKSVSKDGYLKEDMFAGWDKELNDAAYEPTIMPIYLENFGHFARSVAIDSSHEALLGQRSAQELTDVWAEFLTKELTAWKKKNKYENCKTRLECIPQN